MKFTVGVCQFQPDKGRLEATLDHMAECIQQASDEGADLVVFPESSTTGYILEGGVDELSLSASDLGEKLAARVTGLKRPIDASIGFYESAQFRPYNSAGYFEFAPTSHRLVGSYHKFFLPTYHVFDEHRFHQAGNDLGLIETRFGRFGQLICEDVWHSILPALLCAGGAQMILVHSASPARGFQAEKPGNLLRYERMLTALCEEHGMACAMAMLVGFEGGKGMTGGSMILNPFGQIIAQADIHGEQLVLAEIDLDDVPLARSRIPLASDLHERWPDIVRFAQEIHEKS